MFELKTLSKEAIPHALARVERYRLLNEPREAVSICRDILHIDPDNQEALIGLILSLTDQFADDTRAGMPHAMELIDRLKEDYTRAYYTGIICEREAKARLGRRYPGAEYDAYDLLRDAMDYYDKADALHPSLNEDARLRWNTCARIIMERNLQPRPKETREHGLE